MWTDLTIANVERLPRCAGVYLIRSKSKGRVVYIGRADRDIKRALADIHAGLSAKPASDSRILHEHVYQHHQTDLEFGCILRRGRTALLDIEVLTDLLIRHVSPDSNDPVRRERLPTPAVAVTALTRCLCCGRPW